MGTFSAWHILIVAAIILLLFGGQGKISDLMGDVGRGIKAFRTGLTQSVNEPAPSSHHGFPKALRQNRHNERQA